MIRAHRRFNPLSPVATLGLAVALLAGCTSAPNTSGESTAPAQPPADATLFAVTRVSDGDTIRVQTPSGEEAIRMLGVDTPETKDPRKPVQCFDPEASDYTHRQLEGAQVWLEPDLTNDNRDKYGRLLRYVYLADGTLYNAKLISEGYGFAYTVFPLTKLDEFVSLEQTAENAGRGLWGVCRVDESKEVKQTTGPK